MTTYGSLFSGAGGFDLGCDAAGWSCRWQCEIDDAPRSVLERAWPDVPKYRDVREIRGDEIEPVDVITYGFPCQDLSVAGKRAGLDGDRSGLFFEVMRIISEMREATGGTYPRVAVAENVVGLLNADRGAAMGRCLDALADVGALAVEWRVLDAQFFGVPQHRRRVFVVAIFDPRAASGGPVLPKSAGVLGTAGTCVETQPTDAGHSRASAAIGCDDDERLVTTRRRAFAFQPDDQGGTTRGALRVVEVSVSPTLTVTDLVGKTDRGARIVEPGYGVRRLTPLECERAMGWPDDHTRYAAGGTELADSARYKACGNGVVAPVAEYVARNVERILVSDDSE